jgi:hypothetical protein
MYVTCSEWCFLCSSVLKIGIIITVYQAAVACSCDKRLPLGASSSLGLLPIPTGTGGIVVASGRGGGGIEASIALVVDGGGGSSGGGGGSGGLLELGGGLVLGLLELLDVTVEEEVDGDIPVSGAGDGATETKDLTGKEPVAEADGELALVVGGDGNVNVLEGGVGVAEGDDGDVDVGGLADGLRVGAGVGDDQEAGLAELLGDLVGEGTGGEASGDGLGAGVVGELEDSAHAVGAGGDGNDVLGVLDGDDDAGGEHELLPGLANVEDVDTVVAAAPDVILHAIVRVAGTGVDAGAEHHLDVLLLGLHGSRERCESRSHFV